MSHKLHFGAKKILFNLSLKNTKVTYKTLFNDKMNANYKKTSLNVHTKLFIDHEPLESVMQVTSEDLYSRQ